jgi:hypothetical protein
MKEIEMQVEPLGVTNKCVCDLLVGLFVGLFEFIFCLFACKFRRDVEVLEWNHYDLPAW